MEEQFYIAPEDEARVAKYLEIWQKEREALLEYIKVGEWAKRRLEEVEDDIKFHEALKVKKD